MNQYQYPNEGRSPQNNNYRNPNYDYYYYNNPNRNYYQSSNEMNPNYNYNQNPNFNNSYNYNRPYNNNNYNRYNGYNNNDNFNYNNSFYQNPNYNYNPGQNYNPNQTYNFNPNRYNNYNSNFQPNNRPTFSQNVSFSSPQKSFSLSRQSQIVFSTSNRNKQNHSKPKPAPKTPPSLPPEMPSDAEAQIISNITMQEIEMTNQSIMDSCSSVSSEINKGAKSDVLSKPVYNPNKPLISTLPPKKPSFEPSSIIYGDDGVWMFLPLKEEEDVNEKSQEKIEKKEEKNDNENKNNDDASATKKQKKKKNKKTSVPLTSNFSKVISILRSHDEKFPKNVAMKVSVLLTPRKNEHFAFLLDSNEDIVGIYSFGFDSSNIEKVWGDDSLEKNIEIDQIKSIFNYNTTTKSFTIPKKSQIDNDMVGFSL